ncbi:MAG: hypothetical protein JXJ04_06670 [Spirochaetales bacterium]|nr:hypothetical protein [Spirochaetales bacterium]
MAPSGLMLSLPVPPLPAMTTPTHGDFLRYDNCGVVLFHQPAGLLQHTCSYRDHADHGVNCPDFPENAGVTRKPRKLTLI